MTTIDADTRRRATVTPDRRGRDLLVRQRHRPQLRDRHGRLGDRRLPRRPDRRAEAGLPGLAAAASRSCRTDGCGRCTPTRRSSRSPATRSSPASTTRCSGCARRGCSAIALSAIHFWGWQLIIVLAALTLPLGFTHEQGIRGARVADRHADHRRLGGLRLELVRHDPAAPRAAPVRRRSGSTSRRSSPSRCCTSSTRWSCRSACSRATRCTPACRTRWCSGGTATTRSRSS